MSPFRKQRVHLLVEEGFWDGFWRYMAGEVGGRGRMLSYSYAPSWWDEVVDIAAKAGWDAAEAIIERVLEQRRTGKRRLAIGAPPTIPGEVYADAYGAARIGRRR